MRNASPTADQQPLSDLNTTPLIDVMLVLLIMFIITIPLQSHAIKLDVPQPCPSCPATDPVRNEVAITQAGAILWNGIPVSRQELAHNLAATVRMPSKPELHLRPDENARYELVSEVLGITRRVGVTKMGFLGNERYRGF